MSRQRNALYRGCLRAIVFGFLGLGSLYLFIVGLVMTPMTQTYITYAHHIYSSDNLDRPEDHGLAPGKTVNLKIKSLDNTTLGAWFIFADSIHRKTPLHSLSSSHSHRHLLETKIPSAVETRPTILFFHGNTGTRALPLRITVYTGLTARLDVNVFAIDYRGFGDSDGQPTVRGVAMDARAAWDYLTVLQGAKPEDVLIVGHSLGTAVAGLLAAELGKEGIEPRGLVLMSPFSSLQELMVQYYLFGFLPLLRPFTVVPLATRILTSTLHHRFDTLTLVPDVKTSVLLAHGEDDWDIPHSHSSCLFDAFLEPYLAVLKEKARTGHEWDQKDVLERGSHAIVKTTVIPGFGSLQELRDGAKTDGRRIAMLKTHAGGHDIGRSEGVQDVMGRMFGFY